MRQFIYLSLHAYSVFNKIDLERLLLFSLQSRWTCLNVCKCGSRDAFATYETNPNNHDVKLREHGLYENGVSNEHEKEQGQGKRGCGSCPCFSARLDSVWFRTERFRESKRCQLQPYRPSLTNLLRNKASLRMLSRLKRLFLPKRAEKTATMESPSPLARW